MLENLKNIVFSNKNLKISNKEIDIKEEEEIKTEQGTSDQISQEDSEIIERIGLTWTKKVSDEAIEAMQISFDKHIENIKDTECNKELKEAQLSLSKRFMDINKEDRLILDSIKSLNWPYCKDNGSLLDYKAMYNIWKSGISDLELHKKLVKTYSEPQTNIDIIHIELDRDCDFNSRNYSKHRNIIITFKTSNNVYAFGKANAVSYSDGDAYVYGTGVAVACGNGDATVLEFKGTAIVFGTGDAWCNFDGNAFNFGSGLAYVGEKGDAVVYGDGTAIANKEHGGNAVAVNDGSVIIKGLFLPMSSVERFID